MEAVATVVAAEVDTVVEAAALMDQRVAVADTQVAEAAEVVTAAVVGAVEETTAVEQIAAMARETGNDLLAMEVDEVVTVDDHINFAGKNIFCEVHGVV